MKKQEQIESELRLVIKRAKKSVFVKLTLTDLIEGSRRMYLIYNAHKSGEKFKINNNDENILLLNNISSDFENLNMKIKKIPKPIKELLDRKWEKEPNTKESLDGSTEVLLKKLLDLQKEFKKLVMTLNGDFKSEIIINVDPIPIAVTHSAMTIWTELLKNKYVFPIELGRSIGWENYLGRLTKAFSIDSFGESATPDQLMEKYGLSSGHIVAAVKKVISRKK